MEKYGAPKVQEINDSVESAPLRCLPVAELRFIAPQQNNKEIRL